MAKPQQSQKPKPKVFAKLQKMSQKTQMEKCWKSWKSKGKTV